MTIQNDIQKAIEATGVLLSRDRTFRMSRGRLLKLLYIADRESLKERGYRIFPSLRPVAMQRGPLHSEIYDCIKGAEGDASETWARFFISEGTFFVRLKEGVEIEIVELSEYEFNKLEEVVDRYHEVEDEELFDITHLFSEWATNYTDKTSTNISLADMLSGVGVSDPQRVKYFLEIQEGFEKVGRAIESEK